MMESMEHGTRNSARKYFVLFSLILPTALFFLFIPLILTSLSAFVSLPYGIIHLVIVVGFSTLVFIEFHQHRRKHLLFLIEHTARGNADVTYKLISAEITQLAGINLILSVLFLITATVLMAINRSVTFPVEPFSSTLFSYLVRLVLFFVMPPIFVTIGMITWWWRVQSKHW